MPYKYVVEVDSKSFGGAPQPILDALQRLTWAGKRTVGDGTFREFNELLAVGYFEEGKMDVSSTEPLTFYFFHAESSVIVSRRRREGAWAYHCNFVPGR